MRICYGMDDTAGLRSLQARITQIFVLSFKLLAICLSSVCRTVLSFDAGGAQVPMPPQDDADLWWSDFQVGRGRMGFFANAKRRLSGGVNNDRKDDGNTTAHTSSSARTRNSWHTMTPHSASQRYLSTRGGSYDVRCIPPVPSRSTIWRKSLR
jgi:hypothetical protein